MGKSVGWCLALKKKKKMAKLSLAFAATLAACASAFAPMSNVHVGRKTTTTSLSAVTGFEEVGGKPFDPLGLGKLGEVMDTFPNMWPDQQYMQESEIKHGRMSMLAWTGVWATTKGGLGLGLHFPGFPEEPDWTKALGVFAKEEPIWFGLILTFICLAEGESVGHSGDNFRGKSTKTTPGDLNFDYLGLKKKLSPERLERYRIAELKNGRAAMIAMASLFAMKAIPGSVPIMDILGAS